MSERSPRYSGRSRSLRVAAPRDARTRKKTAEAHPRSPTIERGGAPRPRPAVIQTVLCPPCGEQAPSRRDGGRSMTVAGSTARRRAIARRGRPALAGAKLSRRKRVAFFLLANLLLLPAYYLVAEVAFRLFWSPRYWIHTDRLMVGSGQTEVGKKWWPSTTYRVDGSEFRTVFRTNALGYRGRPEPFSADHPYRIAFVGDSFTEAMQVPYEASFCARLEGLMNRDARARAKVCINYGISATDLFD